ncbi:MAG: tetratricopeptide repeat protein [Planctomycetes bacterium]|nr:tetratricopeptide repeat protein [Planctomycetota bacterium]
MAASDAPPAGRTRPVARSASLAAFGAVLAAVLIGYTGALTNHFAYDDHELVTGNDFLKGWMAGAPDGQGRPVDHVAAMLKADFATLASRLSSEVGTSALRINYYRPVIALSYMADTWFWGEIAPWDPKRPAAERATLEWTRINPVGFHLTNVLFHALNSLLVYAVGLALVRRYWAALAAGLLFATHPMHTESVTWIAGRTDVIATTFLLAAFWAYLRHRRRGSRLALAAAAGLFLVALFAKEMAAVLPLLLLVHEGVRARFGPHPDGAARGRRRGLVLVAGFAALIAPYFLLKTALTGGGVAAGPTAADAWAGTSLFTILATLPSAITWYLEKLLLPLRFNLYPMLELVAPAAVALWMPWALAHALVFGTAVWAVLRRGRRLAFVGFCVAGLYLSLTPLSCLVPGLRLARFEEVEFPVAERFVYVPSLLFVWLAGALLAGLVHRRPPWGRAAAIAVLVLAAAGAARVTQARNREWKWNLDIFAATVRSSPDSIRMRLNYGAALTNDVWQVREGRLHFERGQVLSERQWGRAAPPQLPNALADVNYLRKELPLAAGYLRRAFELFGRPVEYGNRVAVTLSIYAAISADPRYFGDALDVFRQVLTQAPHHEMARMSAAFAHETLQVWERHARESIPSDAVVQDFARSFEITAGSLQEDTDPRRRLMALQAVETGLTRLPPAEVLAGLPQTQQVRRLLVQRAGALHRNLAEHYAGLLARFPDRPALHFLLGEVHRIGGLALARDDWLHEARRHYAAVLAAEPDHGAAAIGLADALVRLGEPGAAIDAARRTAGELLREDRSWEGRPLLSWPTRAVEVAVRVAHAARAAPEAGRALVRETWEGALGVLERRARDEEAGGGWQAWSAFAAAEAEAASALGRPALLEQAIAHFRRAAELAPHVELPLTSLIPLYRQVGRHGDARAAEARLAELRARR